MQLEPGQPIGSDEIEAELGAGRAGVTRQAVPPTTAEALLQSIDGLNRFRYRRGSGRYAPHKPLRVSPRLFSGDAVHQAIGRYAGKALDRAVVREAHRHWHRGQVFKA